jgi:23S rRNA pseudouridine1911/1915/1917 synthase
MRRSDRGDSTGSRALVADRGDDGLRLDLVLRRHLTDIRAATRTQVQAWIERGLVTVNGRSVRRVASRAALGDRIEVALPVAPPPAPAPERVDLDVVFEDDHLLAVDKPPGIVVHPTHKHTSGTLLNALLWHARTWTTGQRPSLIGRLDKHTSGVVLVAKTAAMHAALQRTLADRRSRKEYLAVVYGRVSRIRGSIDLRLRRDPLDRRRVTASPTLGAESLTRYERLARTAAPKAGLALLRCTLVTGRTHQIRAHLAASGWPIVGDPVYGEPRWTDVEDPALRKALETFQRQALHAACLVFDHPATRDQVRLEAPPPSDFADLCARAGLVDARRAAGASAGASARAGVLEGQ